ncbi:MAG: hypothetical protein AAFZ49_11890 [Cyanobacteria bacterium J06659_2]
MLPAITTRTAALATLMAFPSTLIGMTAALAEEVVFPIQNDTSASIVEFYITPPTSDSWGPNSVPPGESLLPGETVNMRVQDGYPACIYDMLAIFSDGIEVESFDINICEMTTWVYSDD